MQVDRVGNTLLKQDVPSDSNADSQGPQEFPVFGFSGEPVSAPGLLDKPGSYFGTGVLQDLDVPSIVDAGTYLLS